MHQNGASYTGTMVEGCLLDNFVLVCRRGFAAVYEHYLNCYQILRRHMENGALSAYQLYGYARHRWCVRCPEAVVAYQTGPKRWAVNTCGETISEERAIQRLNSEYGFEASRIKLLGVPYYDATDWNFICFRCGRYDWLMQDGDLHQIYQ